MSSSTIKRPLGLLDYNYRSVSQLSNITENGVYFISAANSSNDETIPQGLRGLSDIVIHIGIGMHKTQVIRSYYPWEDGHGIYIRSSGGDSGTFANWKRLAFTD